jgi:hypothetical protein
MLVRFLDYLYYNNPRFDRKHSDESRKKMSDAKY